MDNQADPPVQITGNTLGRPLKIQVGVSGDVARDYETELLDEATAPAA